MKKYIIGVGALVVALATAVAVRAQIAAPPQGTISVGSNGAITQTITQPVNFTSVDQQLLTAQVQLKHDQNRLTEFQANYQAELNQLTQNVASDQTMITNLQTEESSITSQMTPAEKATLVHATATPLSTFPGFPAPTVSTP